MVGLRTLTPPIKVRILVPQPNKSSLTLLGGAFLFLLAKFSLAGLGYDKVIG